MGSRPIDLSTIIANAFKLFREKLNHVCAGPCDGAILKMHYQWAFYFTLGGFMTVWYGWFFGKIIHCITHFNGAEALRPDYQNICLSYSYIKDENGELRFLLFYRWIHWSLLFLSFLFYLPRKVSKSVENQKAKKILEDLATLSPRYDQSEKDMVQRSTYFLVNNMRTSNSIYFKYLGLNVFALLIDIFALKFLDFLFQGRFIGLVPNSFPFDRDPVHFTDFISQTFPPFVSCTLSEIHKIVPGKVEEIGCHLTNMELYEKLFIIFWFFLYSLIVVTSLYIIYLLLMLVRPLKKYFLRTPKPLQATKPAHAVIEDAIGNFKVGDVYLLYRMRQHLSPAKFYELLFKLGDPQLKPNREQQPHPKVQEPPAKSFYESNRDEYLLRNRDPKVVQIIPPSIQPQPQHPIQPQHRLQPQSQHPIQPQHPLQPQPQAQHRLQPQSQHPIQPQHLQPQAQHRLQPQSQHPLQQHPMDPNALRQLLKNPQNADRIRKYVERMRTTKATDNSILIE